MKFGLTREEIAKAFGSQRAVRAFEQLQESVKSSEEVVTANLGETGELQAATFVTLSANAALPNERVLAFGSGLGFELTDDRITIRVSSNVPIATGGFRVMFAASGDCVLGLPLSGILATRENPEELTNKTLVGAKLPGLGDYADDVAAAAGGVAVDGLYRTGSAIKVRVA